MMLAFKWIRRHKLNTSLTNIVTTITFASTVRSGAAVPRESKMTRDRHGHPPCTKASIVGLLTNPMLIVVVALLIVTSIVYPNFCSPVNLPRS